MIHIFDKINILNRSELTEKIYNTCHLTGNFLLRSGQTSTEYFDKYRLESNPDLLFQIAFKMKDLIPKDTDVLAGLEMGGIPIATTLSLITGIPVCFVRKEAKKYGTCQFAEGLEIKGKKLCIVEDVITSGGQVILSSTDLREKSGAHIDSVLCIINRGENDAVMKLKQQHLDLISFLNTSDFKK